MTDEEIIKALECCGTDGCTECPFMTSKLGCDINIHLEALDLINRKQAEIERLNKQLKTAKSEAIKEFSEKLKQVSQYLPLAVISDSFVSVSQIDNLVKEMMVKQNDKH